MSDNPLIPESSPDDPWYLKALDVASAPARELVKQLAWPLVAGAEAWDAAKASPNLLQDPTAQHKITDAALALGATTALPLRPAGSLGIFGGIRSATHSTADLAEAQSMREAGRTPLEIWHQTGWHNDVGGDWKYEIPDEGASLKVPLSTGRGGMLSVPRSAVTSWPPKLGEILDHPELFKAYPELKDMPIHSLSVEDIARGTRGTYWSDKSISLKGQPAPELLSTLLHEIQHGIQHIENFPRGGSPETFLPDNFMHDYQYAQQNKATYDHFLARAGFDASEVHEAFKAGMAGKATPQQQEIMQHTSPMFFDNQRIKEFVDDYQQYKDLHAQWNEAWQKYHHIAGEVEARNVQERQHWYPSHRIDVPPWGTPGYPIGKGQTILRYDPDSFWVPQRIPMP